MQQDNIPGVRNPVSRLVQGTMMLGTERLDESFDLLDGVMEQGGNTFDTAHGYGGGDCERTLGCWMQERDNRDQVNIIGKGAHHSRDRKRVTPFDIASDIHDSLARLQTDFIDIYLLHRDDPDVPVGPIVEALNEHHTAGRIGVFGGSNWSAKRIQEVNEYAEANGLQPFVASSPNFSLAVQRKEPWADCISISAPDRAEDRAWYLSQQMPLFTWSSLASGFFSGRFERDNLDTFEAYWDKLCVDCYCTEENFQRLDRVKILADENGLSIPQIAVAYVLNHPLNVFALVGCRNRNEFRANAEASSLTLTPEEIAWLELKSDSR
ncbi:aldo/keto reductase [Chloroflexi bacterium TSY]|nr:aldo/keto reductase [Chloroflexi bacterium TSY]